MNMLENQMFYLLLHQTLREEWFVYCSKKAFFSESASLAEESSTHVMTKSVAFRPDPKGYLDLLNNVNTDSPTVIEAGYSRDSFYLLFDEMIGGQLYKFSRHSPEVENFIERALKEKALLAQEASEELHHKFQQKKRLFLSLNDELGNRLLYLEKIRLRNANTHFNWHGIFGMEFVKLSEIRMRLDIVQRKMALLDQHPEYSHDDLDQKLAKSIKEEQSGMNALKLEVAYAKRGLIFPDGSTGLSQGELDDFRKESKQVLREIFTMLHPDVLQHNPDFCRLTQSQQQKLKMLWDEVMALKEDEVGFAQVCVGHNIRNPHMLKSIREQAKSILANAGVDTDTRLIIQGDTLAEQLDWLENAIKSTQDHIMIAQAEQKALLDDHICREREIMLQWPKAKQEELSDHYAAQGKKLEKEVIRLEAELEKLLSGRS